MPTAPEVQAEALVRKQEIETEFDAMEAAGLAPRTESSNGDRVQAVYAPPISKPFRDDPTVPNLREAEIREQEAAQERARAADRIAVTRHAREKLARGYLLTDEEAHYLLLDNERIAAEKMRAEENARLREQMADHSVQQAAAAAEALTVAFPAYVQTVQAFLDAKRTFDTLMADYRRWESNCRGYGRDYATFESVTSRRARVEAGAKLRALDAELRRIARDGL